MRIISHRGFWLEPREKNSIEAFQRTVDDGFGTETDFRDLNGDLVISHDPPTSSSAIAVEKLMEIFRDKHLVLAANVKSDGVGSMIKEVMDRYEQEYFAFDMSGPQLKQYTDLGIPSYTRHSDVEPEPILYGKAAGVWLDDFAGGWISEGIVREHLSAHKQVCVVSSELHGRSGEELWEMLRSTKLTQSADLTLCTDLPTKAVEFFGSRT